MEKQNKYIDLIDALNFGGVHVITGKNGSGKSRFLQYSTSLIFNEIVHKKSRFAKMICFSGTMHDKYPRDIYASGKLEDVNESVVYLGNKVNNNMISDLAPFRVLARHILNCDNVAYNNQNKINSVFSIVGFDSTITLKFRYAKGRKNIASSKVAQEINLDFTGGCTFLEDLELFYKHIVKGDLLLSDMVFSKNNKFYGLSDLSSGEKQYILTLLGCLFCGGDNAVLFYDEPENSLHPTWQLNIVRNLVEISSSLYPCTTIIVATHSPLIVGSIKNTSSFLCDFSKDYKWHKVKLFGKTSDSILREQFHLFSARTPEVAILVNKSLSMITNQKQSSNEFKAICRVPSD